MNKAITYSAIVKIREYISLQHVLVLCICLLLIILPSVNMPDLYNSTQTGKFIFFAYAMIGITFLFVVQLMIKKEIKVSLSVLDVLLFVLLAYIIINRYFIQDIYSFSLRFYELIGLSVLYVILRSIPRKYYIFFLLAVIAGGIIQAIYGNLQLLGFYNSFNSNFKMTGTFFNPGPYAGYLAAIFPMALGIYLFRNKLAEELPVIQHMPQWLRQVLLEYLPLAGVLSILLVLPASRSRAAWLAAGMSSFLLLAIKYQFKYHFYRIFNTVYKKILVLSLMVLIAAGSMYGIYLFKKDSADGRLLIWTVSANIIKDYPLFGVGFDRFKAHYMNYQAAYFQDQPESKYAMVADNVEYAFNEVLQFQVEFGLFGLLILMVIGFVKASSIIKMIDKLSVYGIILASLGAIIVFSVFSYSFQFISIKIIILIIVVISNTKCLVNFHFTRKSNHIHFLNGAKIFALFLLVYAINNYLFKLYDGYKIWRQAKMFYLVEQYELSNNNFNQIYSTFNRNGNYLQHLGKTLCIINKQDSGVIILNKANQHISNSIICSTLGQTFTSKGEFEKAENAYLQSSNMVPSTFYSKYLLAKLYRISNQDQKAKCLAMKIIDMHVKVPSRAIDQIKVEMKDILNQTRISTNY